MSAPDFFIFLLLPVQHPPQGGHTLSISTISAGILPEKVKLENNDFLKKSKLKLSLTAASPKQDLSAPMADDNELELCVLQISSERLRGSS
ncbi:hypothetical protein L3X38_013607 [Prunus dulcis]|uniref:Uncharacterized protein n=1 Tax=Prunus dulcis TaxID=3755 RepID=A0AAD4ZH58_PRUDU|nr:hypothetical protein L3X38_013607 [Prunus dulcis]